MHAIVRNGVDAKPRLLCLHSEHWVHCTQVYVSTEVAAEVGGLKALTSTGTSVLVQGTLRRTPEGTLQVHTPCQHGPLLTPHSCNKF